VIDPMSPDSVVITGSHNQGFRASYANDENFIIVRGHQPLAQAYASHVMDVYDHYRWRFTLKTTSIKNAFSGLDPTPQWQDKYYATNSIARRESLLWTGQLPALPNAPAPAVPMKPVEAKQTSGRPKVVKVSTAKRKRTKRQARKATRRSAGRKRR
jgi:phosphatidylserine/phosphatidylglycerophosphate/cardiolipin synthase-like enzyme